ncbi:hypothetical protein [Pseudoteredinibacter isoporae]|uniref:Uncharacterized protein n=1 Tax=Pseudoteredinibacter isoporae TaxID=570281 RepID=A0A7X0MXE7_9GAMM|nr:hypothetical protein [Pseudoteredinibacter isoporae]MBB6523651.1 hypothetical protein [Pseudoteredinibacter isoporae]NHO89156.1 hypothetical protein [Pseudoteredinibacter isoporae]NIB22233.1 hypothetical protein [Pseudoteredinibacter isoporae]
MKSFLLVFISVSISLSIAWLWHNQMHSERAVNPIVPNSVHDIYREGRFDNQFIRVDGYMKLSGSGLALYQDKDAAHFRGPVSEPELAILVPPEKIPQECINSYIRISGRSKYTVYGFAVDNLRLFWSLELGMNCLPEGYYDKDLKASLDSKTKKAKKDI